MSEGGIKQIQDLASKEGVTWSQMVRTLLSEAVGQRIAKG